MKEIRNCDFKIFMPLQNKMTNDNTTDIHILISGCSLICVYVYK